jgi:chaperonin GroEL (HSP60 family)
MNGEVRDNVAAGILEPTMSKVRSLKSAYEAAVTLLRIDDAIQCVPGSSRSTRAATLTVTKLAEPKGGPDGHGL